MLSKPTKRAALGDLRNLGKKALTKGLSQRNVNVHQRAAAPSKAAIVLEDAAPMEVEGAAAAAKPGARKVLPAGVTDIDIVDAEDPQLVVEYVDDIVAYQKELEGKQGVRARYMTGVQTDITPNMRRILVDWLVEVHIRFQLQQETLYMTFHILDRFLQVQNITRSKLQLAGITAMLVASKYEEMYPPEVRDFVWIADNAYTREQIISMEGLLLKTLDYNLGCPLPLHFLRRYSKAVSADQETHHLAKYLMELSISAYSMCGFRPSEIATAAMYLASTIMNPEVDGWSKNLEYYSEYSFAEVERCVREMTVVVVKSVSIKQQAVRRKYASSKLLKISELPELDTFIKAN